MIKACGNAIRAICGSRDGIELYYRVKDVVYDVADNGPFLEILVGV